MDQLQSPNVAKPKQIFLPMVTSVMLRLFNIHFSWKCQIFLFPMVRRVPKDVRIILFRIGKVLFVLVLYRILLSLGLLLMDDLSRAVAPFLPSSSGGGLPGVFNTPPGSSGEPSLPLPYFHENENEKERMIIESSAASVGDLLAEAEAEELTSTFDQDTGAGVDREIWNEIELTLESKLRTYCRRPRVVNRFPNRNFSDLNFSELAKHMAREDLDLSCKSTEQLLEMKNYWIAQELTQTKEKSIVGENVGESVGSM